MTNEDARHWLEIELKLWESECKSKHPVKEALDMAIEALEQEPKIGRWEQYGYPWEDKFKCSECGKEQPKILCGEKIIGHWSDYCPNCGAKMFEPQESEE